MRINHFLSPPRFGRYLVYPESFGHYRDEPTHGETRPAGSMDGYNWHIVRSGRGYVRLDGEYRELRAGMGFLYGPGLEQIYRADENEPWDVRWAHLRGEGVRQLLGGRGEENVWLFSWQGAERLDVLWDELLAHGEPSLSVGEARLSALLYEMLAILAQHSDDAGSLPARGRTSRLIEAAERIRSRAELPLTLERMAEAAGYSASHFSRQFHALFGRTPVEFLTECRIARAKTLLVSTDQPVKAIAERVGFASSAYFIQRFRRSEGVTPERFRLLRGGGRMETGEEEHHV